MIFFSYLALNNKLFINLHFNYIERRIKKWQKEKVDFENREIYDTH